MCSYHDTSARQLREGCKRLSQLAFLPVSLAIASPTSAQVRWSPATGTWTPLDTAASKPWLLATVGDEGHVREQTRSSGCTPAF